MPLLKTVFKYAVRGLAVIGLMVVLVSAVGWGIILTREKPKLSEEIILTLDLTDKIPESTEHSALPFSLDDAELSLRDIVSAIDLAAKDDRVKLVIGNFRNDGAGYTQAQEIRAAIYRLRNEEKMAFATATSFGELGPADRAYYTAAAFNEIWLQPVGVVGLTGFAAQSPFLRGTLDKIGAEADFLHREEYKSAANMMTETGYTPAVAEMMGSIVDDISMQVVNDVAADRAIAPLDLIRLIDHAPLSAKEARDSGLIDRIGYFDELADWAVARLGPKAELVPAADYLDLRRHEMKAEEGGGDKKGKDATPVVAFIHAVGEIRQDSGGVGRGGSGIAADELAQALQDAVNDASVEAVLIRLDSPGGSAVASETIRYAMSRVRAAGLPIIVSMAGMAGSGAYWMATEADYVVADPATLTGSIGVVAGKIAGTRIWNELGISWDMIASGDNADMWSVTVPFTPLQRQRVDELVGETYADFKSRVAAGRDMTLDQVAAVAKGRVWTGHQAFNLGLVDELGGFYEAITVTKNLVGLLQDEKILLKTFPEDENFLTRIKKSLGKIGQFGVMIQSAMAWLNVAMPTLDPAVRALAAPPRQALMPSFTMR